MGTGRWDFRIFTRSSSLGVIASKGLLSLFYFLFGDGEWGWAWDGATLDAEFFTVVGVFFLFLMSQDKTRIRDLSYGWYNGYIQIAY